MVFNYRKIYTPSTGNTTDLHHLPPEEQALPIKLQSAFNSFELSRHSLLLCAKS